MPYTVIPVGNKKYEVKNSLTGKIHAKHSTFSNAEAQLRLLRAIEHNPAFQVRNTYR